MILGNPEKTALRASRNANKKIGPSRTVTPGDVDASGQPYADQWTLTAMASFVASVPSKRLRAGALAEHPLAHSLLCDAWMPRLNGTGSSCPAKAKPGLRAADDSRGRLGLAQFNEQSWDTFWALDPNRRPAHYALAKHACEVSDEPRARSFDRAQHHALLFGLSFRIADRPFMRSSRFSSLRDSLLGGWLDALTDACCDRPLAKQAIERALSLLRAGTQLEASSLRIWRLAPATYAEQTWLKLRWRLVAPRLLLQQCHSDARAAEFERCYDLFGMSVQCLIDAMDADERHASSGVSVPRLLGLADEALVEAAIVLVERAAERAARFGFGAFCEWLGRFDRFLRGELPQGDRLRFGIEGRALGEILAREL